MRNTTHAIDATGGARGDADPSGAAHGGAGHAGTGHGGHGQGEALGPFGWRAWGAGLLGIAAGLAVAACFWLSANL